MQSVSSRIWTRVAVFISYDDNNYTTAPPPVLVRKLLVRKLYPPKKGKYGAQIEYCQWGTIPGKKKKEKKKKNKGNKGPS